MQYLLQNRKKFRNQFFFASDVFRIAMFNPVYI